MILSNVALYDGPVSRYVSATGVPFLSVEYRYAPEFPHPHPVHDSSAGLRWLHDHAEELGVDPGRIAVMGDSGGGEVAAGLAIHTRDEGGPAVARQILIYPMLDDRNVDPDPELIPLATWSYDDNWTGWTALLGEARGTDGVPPSASPARRLASAGVSTELHVHPSVPHAYETFAFASRVAKRSARDRIRVIQSL